MKGTREQRAILIRDPNKLICASVLSSPKVSAPEVRALHGCRTSRRTYCGSSAAIARG